MIIAQQKKKNNIAEYILYMFQIEDMIRGYDFDLKKIETNIIHKFEQPVGIIEEMSVWYGDLIEKMQKEGLKKKNHLSFLNEIMDILFQLQEELLKDTDELKFIEQYKITKPNIDMLRTKSSYAGDNEIVLCMDGLYGFLLLRLQGKEVSQETVEGISSISSLIVMLTKKYHERH